MTRGVQRARQLLTGNGSPLGLLGSSRAYRQVWARDSMVGSLGLLLCGDDGAAINRRSLDTLRQYQSELGRIPHNVGMANVHDPALIAHGGMLTGDDGDVILDTAHSGCVDNNLWYIIGHYYHYLHGGDTDYLRAAWDSLKQALLWLRYQDSNECGLLEVHEAMDWADLFANRYNVLFDNVLYFAAWRCMAHMAAALGDDAAVYQQHADDVKRKINVLLWVGHESPKDWDAIARERKEWLYTLKRIETELVERPFYLPYVAFRDYADRFDTLANLLAVVFGVADSTQANKILDYIHNTGLNEPHPVRALYPVIQPGDKDWRDYYRVRNLNLPHHYHNGGSWAFIGGFYVAALVQAGRVDEAQTQLDRLAAMNRIAREGEWGFNEWFHGQSGRAMGYDGQSWSAAMFIYAADAVNNAKLHVFNQENGWKIT